MKGETIFIGSDHAGFELKEKIKRHFDKRKINYEDLGAHILDESDDYPDYAFKVAEAVSENKNSKGILICGSGVGMAIAANKVRGVRAVEAFDSRTAKMSREHNDSNVLALSGWNTTFEKMKKIIDVWVKTKFSKQGRHERRIKKIEEYEK